MEVQTDKNANSASERAIMTEKEYKEFLETMDLFAKMKSTTVFKNDSPEHANAVISTIFMNVQKEDSVRIFAKSLNGQKSDVEASQGQYYNSLRHFMYNCSGQLRIVIDEDDSSNSRIKRELRSYQSDPKFKNRVEVKMASEKFQDSIKKLAPEKQQSTIYFVTGGNDMFRVEYNPTDHLATFCFNNKQVTERLNKEFDENFSSCQEAKL